MSSEVFRVLVADDFDGMRDLLTAALESTGRFEVVATCTNGDEALEAVRTSAPDLALLDLGMPGSGGMGVLTELTAAAPDTRVIVVSGFPRGRLAHRAVGYGALGYVEKGLSAKAMVDDIVTVAGLVETVAWVLGEHRTHLERDPRSSSVARRFVEEALRRWDCDGMLDTVKLLVSELVTNSVLHARSAPDVAVLLKPDAIRIEVSDQGGELPDVPEAPSDATSGRGVSLVKTLSSAWGVERAPGGKTIWFEIARPGSAQQSLDGAINQEQGEASRPK